MDNIKPLGDRVLVKRFKAEATKIGIILPESAKEKPKEGEVVAVGPGRLNDEGKREPLGVKKGDRVLFAAYAGTELKEEGDGECLILSEKDILGVLV